VEIRLRKIQSIKLNEGGDEIYLTAKSNQEGGCNHEIRRAGDSDYWRFDAANVVRSMDLHVGRVRSHDEVLTIRLMEQDNATLGNAHDRVGFVDALMPDNSGIVFAENSTAEHLGVDDGLHVVLFKGDGKYKVWFAVVG
jgi:hypothetical protein